MNKEEKLMLKELYSSANADQRLILEKLVPELKESEDEWIRKWIIDDIKYNIDNEPLNNSEYKKQGEKAIAWLEKQGEQKPTDKIEQKPTWSEEDEYLLNETIQHLEELIRIDKAKHCACDVQYYQRDIDWLKSLRPQNQGEPSDQNLSARQYLVSKGYPVNTGGDIPTYKELYEIIKEGIMNVDEVEPKFKVGDWITDNNSTCQIVRVENEWYYVDDGDKICFDVAHQYYRLWTIEDAKDGDVLVNQNGEMPFIFSTYKENHIFCHCGYTNRKNIFFDKFVDKDGSLLHWANLFHEKVYPATEQQRELLFQKMKEAGFKWENNQLEKINANGDYVDLGLPSGTLWAKCNLGAEKETDFGLYCQWGDTQGYESVYQHRFNWTDYKWEDKDNITKYNETDKKLILDNEDDPVFVATNGKFKSPTKDQLQELINHTDHKWTSIDGVNGMKFINKKDDTKYIFIPAAGYCTGGHYNVGSWGYIWSVSSKESNENDAWSIYFYAGNVGMYSNYRCIGHSVRGILNK